LWFEQDHVSEIFASRLDVVPSQRFFGAADDRTQVCMLTDLDLHWLVGRYWMPAEQAFGFYSVFICHNA